MFGEWLRAQRETRGWSQSHLARLIGVSPQAINQLERGKNALPGAEFIPAYARVLGVTVDEVYAAAGLGPAPTPRGVLLAELRQRTRALNSPRYIQAVLDEIESHQDASDDTWTALTSVLHSLIMEAEAEQRAQGAQRPPSEAGMQHHAEAWGASWPAAQPARQRIHDERGEYHAGPAVGC